MDKECFSLILNGAMRNYFDGVDINQLINEYGYNPKVGQIAIKLSMYLSGLSTYTNFTR